MAAESFGAGTMRRIESLTLVIGSLGAAWGAWHWGWRGGLGVALGAGISWINFRWLKGGVQAMGAAATALAAQTDPAQLPPPAPKAAYAKFLARFALLVVTVYVILTRSWLPPISVLTGLFASAAAVVVGLIFEIVSSSMKQGAGGPS